VLAAQLARERLARMGLDADGAELAAGDASGAGALLPSAESKDTR
jgi:hypothetical protein